MSDAVPVRPDERLFRYHLEQPSFQSGADRGWWRSLSIAWPHAVISVTAAARDGGPAEYDFRFECSNYPSDPMAGQLWDAAAGRPLDPAYWPAGGPRVTAAFNPGWNAQAIYLPCDRVAIISHDGWRQQHPEMIWGPTKDVTFYLRILRGLLTAPDYTGARRSRS